MRFELVSVRDEKIVAIDTFTPKIYTVDPRNRNVEDTYVLHSPELTTAKQSSVRTASATSMLIYTAADARGTIYRAISPYPATVPDYKVRRIWQPAGNIRFGVVARQEQSG